MALDMLVTNCGFLDGGWVVPNLYRMTGWGWFIVACGLPGSLFFAFKSRRFAFFLVGQLLAAFVILGTVLADSTCLRFLIWLPGPFAIGFFGEADSVGLPRPIVAVLSAAALLSSTFGLLTGLVNATRIDWVSLVRDSGSRPGVNGALQRNLTGKVPDDADIAVFMGREGPLYIAFGTKFTHGIVTIEASDTEIDFAKNLDDAGVRYLFYPGWPRECPSAAASLGRQIDEGLMLDLRYGLFQRAADSAFKSDGTEK